QSPDIFPRVNRFLAFANDGSLSVVALGLRDRAGKPKYSRPLMWEGLTGEIGSELEERPVAIDSHARFIATPTTVVNLGNRSRVPEGAIDASRELQSCRFSSDGRWLIRHTVDRQKKDFFEVCDLNS